MLTIILLLVVGSLLVYISKYNFMLVSINFGQFVLSDIPLFYVIVGSIILGLLLSYILYLAQAISTSFTLRGKNNQIKKNKSEVLELTKRVHQLELEKEKLKHEPRSEPEDDSAL